MISVKDKEVVSKRQAFLETIQMHKKQWNTHQNACFSSGNPRLPKPTPAERERMQLESSYGLEEHAGNKTAPLNKFTSGSFDKASTQSTFGLTFQGGHSVE